MAGARAGSAAALQRIGETLLDARRPGFVRRDCIISVSIGWLALPLGGFNDGGLERLRALGDELKTCGYLPAIFDFDREDSHSCSDKVEIAGEPRALRRH